jgi:antitoxin component YwqK of YwqJK toxin-antitoxin module
MKPVLVLAALAGTLFLARGLVADLSAAQPEPRITYYGNGAKKNATEFEDGVRSGGSRQWYPGGQLEWEGNYEDGYREGEWTFWLENGEVDAERTGTYVGGKKAAVR